MPATTSSRSTGDPGGNTAHVVVGLLTNRTGVHPDGMTRMAILADPTQGLGNLAEPECRRVNAALALALERGIPVEWYAVSSGALIALDSGTENMDWISLTLRRLIEYTQAGGEVNIIITGITVGGQPYWNAEATMLMHTKGILVMTPASTMVLTGKQALDYSGAVSADDNQGIGGFDRIMGPNGQAQYWAPSFPEACRLLLRHYDFTYVVPGERFPRRRPTDDPVDRDVRPSPHARLPESSFTTVGDVFDPATNPERKLPFDMRSVMRAVADRDVEPLERWRQWQDADTAIVWDGTVGGIPVCMIGIESHTVRRTGFVPSYGPPAWTSGTLFPQASRKIARAVNAVSGNRPLVVLANLSGFDGSPESMRNWQLEYGAEIGRAVTNFCGPHRLRRRLEVPRRCLRRVLQGSHRDHRDRRGGGVLRLGDRRRSSRGDGVRPRGQATRRERPASRECPRAGGLRERSRGSRAPGPGGQDRRRGALAEAARCRRRVRRHPHHRTRTAGRVGRPDHPGRDAAPVRRRRTRTGDGAHPRGGRSSYAPGVTSGLSTQL